MRQSKIVRFSLILLSIITVFTAIPCASQTSCEEISTCVASPDEISHAGCLPALHGEAIEEVYTDSDGEAVAETVLPLSWESADSDILTADERENCTAIYEGLVAMSSKITLAHKVTTTELASLYKRIIYSSPELFYVNSSYGYSYQTISGVNYAVSVSPRYTMTAADVASARIYVEERVANLLKMYDPSWEDIEAVLFYHDYIALNFSYDKRLYTQGSAYVNYDVYNFLVEGTGVCMAYQGLLMSILDQIGIENSYAENGGHIWNVVKIDGKWYHVDATFDDPIVNYTDYNGFHGLIEHEFFMKSDAYLSANGYDAWNCDYTCTDTAYDTNTVINNTYSAFIIKEEGWYYIDKENAKLMLYNSTTGTSSTVVSISPSLTTCYASAYGYGDYIIYNGAYSVFAYDTVNKKTMTLKTKSSSSGYILGFTVSDAVVDYIVGTTFTESSWIHETYSLCDSEIGHISLKDFSYLTIDTENKLIEDILGEENKVSDIKGMLANNASNIIIKDSDGIEITGVNTNVGTGYQIILSINGVVKDSLTVVVNCDTDGDGYVTVADASKAMSTVYGAYILEGAYSKAADFDSNGIITVIDVMNVLNNI